MLNLTFKIIFIALCLLTETVLLSISIYKELLTLLLVPVFAIIENPDLGDLLQGMGMALLTILIPLSIAVLTGFLEQKFNKDNKINAITELEISMILDFILNIKQLIISSILIFIPTLFWEGSNNWFRLLELIIWSIGNTILIYRIIFIYRWIKSSDFSFHRTYLSKLRDTNEMARVWKSVWERDELDLYDESQFLTIFTKKVDDLIRHEK